MMISKHVHSLKYIHGKYMEWEEEWDTLYFHMKLYDSTNYNAFMIHRLSYRSDAKAIACAPKPVPSLFFKPQVLVFTLLRQLL